MKPLQKYQLGQSITEFAVVAVVLVPLVMLTSTLGKVGDVNHSTMQAARYSAWERALVPNTGKSDAQIGVEVQNRLMGNSSSLIRSSEGLNTSSAHQNPMWRGVGKLAGVDARLFGTGAGEMKVSSIEDEVPGAGAGALSSFITSTANVMGKLSGGNFDVEEDGLYTAHIAANIRPDKYLTNSAKMQNCDNNTDYVFVCVRRSNTILADTWSSSSPEQVKDRVKALVPMGAFDDVADVISKIGIVPLFSEMKDLEHAPGYVAPDVIPADRLGSYE